MNPEAGNTTEPEISEEEVEGEPVKRRGLWDRIIHREKKEDAEGVDEVEEPSVELTEEEKALRTKEFVDTMEQMSAQEWREKKIKEKYGDGRIGWLKSFTAGERNFSIDEDGEIRRKGWTELGQKAIVTVFNSKTVTAASTLAIVGIFTGGVGLPAAGALFGSMAGRSVVEAMHSVDGKERGLREEIALEEFKEFGKLQEQAIAVNDLDITDEERNERIGGLVDAYYSINENVEAKQLEIIAEQKVWNKRRRIGEFIGGAIGLAAGIGTVFHGLAQKAMTMDIDGNGVAHAVEKVNGAWHYVYNTTAEAVQAAQKGANIVIHGGQNMHLLGSGPVEVVTHAAQNLAGEVAQVGAVVAALFAGRMSERRQDEKAVENYNKDKAVREEYNVEKRTEYGGGGGGTTETMPITETVDWQTAFQEAGKPMPTVGSIWQVEGAPNYLKINEIDPESGVVIADIVDDDYKPVQTNISFALNDLLTHGRLDAGIEPVVTQSEAPEPDDVIPELKTPENKTKKPSLIESILGFADKTDLESKAEFEESIRKVMEILKKEEAVIELKRGIPTIIIPDLHARREMLRKVLNRIVNGKKVSALLKLGKINIVCLGDGMHSENEENWGIIGEDGIRRPKLEDMDREMVDSFNLMQMIMELKVNFPENFQYLRGNHDEIKGGFRKYHANISQDVHDWVVGHYGADFVNDYATFEEALPLMAVGDGFIASHAASSTNLTREDINSRDENVSWNLRWTDNTKNGTNEEAVNGTLANLGTPDGVYIIGHRGVSDAEGLSREQFNGKLIQVNNPDRMIIGLVEPGGKPVFEELK